MRDLRKEITEYLPSIGYRVASEFGNPYCLYLGNITVETVGEIGAYFQVWVDGDDGEIGEYWMFDFPLTEETIDDLKALLAMPKEEIAEFIRALNRL